MKFKELNIITEKLNVNKFIDRNISIEMNDGTIFPYVYCSGTTPETITVDIYSKEKPTADGVNVSPNRDAKDKERNMWFAHIRHDKIKKLNKLDDKDWGSPDSVIEIANKQ